MKRFHAVCLLNKKSYSTFRATENRKDRGNKEMGRKVLPIQLFKNLRSNLRDKLDRSILFVLTDLVRLDNKTMVYSRYLMR